MTSNRFLRALEIEMETRPFHEADEPGDNILNAAPYPRPYGPGPRKYDDYKTEIRILERKLDMLADHAQNLLYALEYRRECVGTEADNLRDLLECIRGEGGKW